MEMAVVVCIFPLVAGFALLVRLLWQRFSGTPALDGGEQYEYQVGRGRGRSVYSLQIGIEAPDSARFEIRRENVYDRAAKHFGICAEIETRDRDFDSTVFVVSDDRTLARLLSADAEFRAAVLELFRDANLKRVESQRGMLWVRMVPKADGVSSMDDDEIAGLYVARIRAALVRIRDRMQQWTARPWAVDRDPAERSSRAVLIAAGALGVVGAIAFVLDLPSREFPRQLLFDHIDLDAALVSVIVVASAVLTLFLLVGRTSRTHLVLVALLLLATPATWLAGRAYFTWQNEQADPGPMAEFVTSIADSYVRSGKSRSFFLVVSQWPDARFDETLQVSQDLYERYPAGSCVRFELHPGSLRDSWVGAIGPDTRCR